jgi:crotonobetainyl-CoA:carnitine CoA-transferase CaiB-like acyl-CoA transferase
VYAPEQLLASPQLEQRQFFRRAVLESGAAFPMPGLPFPVDFAWPAQRPPPARGRHNQLVYGSLLRHSEDELAAWEQAGII